MKHPLQCQCGLIKGHVMRPGMAHRVICYCTDCQAFANYLKRADTVLDEHGGTEVLATQPKYVEFTQGLDQLACMSLSSQGLLRWYAKCCNTPISNTQRNFKFSLVSLVAACLENDAVSMQESFGPVRTVVNTKSARGYVRTTPLRNIPILLSVIGAVMGTRLSGRYRRNPFFSATGTPIVAPIQLSKAERERVTPVA